MLTAHSNKMVRETDRVFITFAQTALSKDDLKGLMEQLGCVRGVFVMEPHADGGIHLHAACSGKFDRRSLASKLHALAPEGQSINILYAHAPKGNQKRGSNWPFALMVQYITNPTKDKVVDDAPLIFGGDDIADVVAKHADAKDSKANTMAALLDLKENRAPVQEVIELLTTVVDKDSSYMYRMYMDYYQHLQRTKPVLTSLGHTPRPWQRVAAAFAAKPIHDNSTSNRGLWINLPSGSGKSWLQSYLYDNYSVFIPGVRPTGDYDLISFRSYDGQEIILLNDLSASVFENSRGETVVKWKRNVLNLLKCICDNVPLAIEFGGVHTELHFKAKIIISSNFPLPSGATDEERRAFIRRYVVIDNEETIQQMIDEAGYDVDPMILDVPEITSVPGGMTSDDVNQGINRLPITQPLGRSTSFNVPDSAARLMDDRMKGGIQQIGFGAMAQHYHIPGNVAGATAQFNGARAQAHNPEHMSPPSPTDLPPVDRLFFDPMDPDTESPHGLAPGFNPGA